MRLSSAVSDFVETYSNPGIFNRFFIGFSCGVPFLLTLTVLDLWLKDCGVSNTAIGFFTFLHAPFTLKFLWAVFIDRFNFPFISKYLGRRKGWAVASQLLLFFGITGMAFSNPGDSLFQLICCASLVAFADGCQDLSLYKYQVCGTTKTKMLGPIAGVVIFGYRVGMFLSKSLSLYLAHYFGWKIAYFVMASTIFVCMFFILNIEEPQEDTKKPLNFGDKDLNFCKAIKSAIHDCLVEPFEEFMKRSDWKKIVWVIVLFRMGDMIAQKMAKPFFIEMGFSVLEIANVVQVFGTVSTLIGSVCGGYFIKVYGIRKSMLFTSAAHAISCLSYVAMSIIGYNMHMLYFTAFIENITGGMMSTSLIAFLYSLCNKQYGTTQYALLWAFYDIGGIFCRAISGVLADILGWTYFFSFAVTMFLPGILMLKTSKSSQ